MIAAALIIVLVLSTLIIGPAATVTLVAGLLCLRHALHGIRSLDPPKPA